MVAISRDENGMEIFPKYSLRKRNATIYDVSVNYSADQSIPVL